MDEDPDAAELDEWAKSATNTRSNKSCAYCRCEESRAWTERLLRYCLDTGFQGPMAAMHRKVEEKSGLGLGVDTFRKHVRRCFPELHARYKAL